MSVGMEPRHPAAPNLAAIAALAAIAWLAYYQLCSGLGLYQDDAFMHAIVRGAQEGVLREAFDLSKGYGGEGRWGTQVVMVLFTWAGLSIGGVPGLYVVCWMLLAGTAVMAYVTLRQLFPPAASFLAAVFLVLYPPDAAKFFAVTYMAHLGAIIFWIAAWLVLKARPIAAAFVLASTFIMGEAFIIPGVLLPLLAFGDARRSTREAFLVARRFLVTYAAVIVPAIVLRLTFAPGRAAGALANPDRLEMIRMVFASMYHGMAATLTSFAYRASEFLAAGGSAAWTVAIAVGLLVLTVHAYLSRQAEQAGAILPFVPARVLALVAFGILFWAATYPLYGLYPARFPPSVIVGKLSNVHGQGAIGLAVLAACVVTALGRADRARWAVAAFITATAAFLGAVAGNFMQIQQRYVDNWAYQVEFWRNVPRLVPDLGPRSLVIVEAAGAEATRLDGFSNFDWSMPHLFRYFWQPPSTWPTYPLFVVEGMFQAFGRVQDDTFKIEGYPTLPAREFARSDVVRLRVENGRVTRTDERASAGARTGVALEPVTTAAHDLTPGPLLRNGTGASENIFIIANNYSSADWNRGVSVRESSGGGMFYFLASSAEALPVRVGSILQFVKTGRATVTRVDTTPQGGMVAVFVTVDRPLDPAGDGFPNNIKVTGQR